MRTTALRCTFYRGSALGTALGITMLALLLADSVSAQVDDETQSFLSLINEYRAQDNLSSLSLDAKLQDGANWMSEDMLASCVAGRYICTHTDSTGRTFDARLRDFGYPAGVTADAGENLAWGSNGEATSARQAFDLWRNSPGHNANMLGSSYVAIGISRSCRASNCAWATDFGSQIIQPLNPTIPTTAPTPTPVLSPAPVPALASGGVSGYTISDTNSNRRLYTGEKGLPGWGIRLAGTVKLAESSGKKYLLMLLGFA